MDCATAADPCVIGAADISDLSNLSKSGGMAITFDPNSPPPPPPHVSLTPSTGLLDRQQVAVYATGFLSGEQVEVGQCVAAAGGTCDPGSQFGGYGTADPTGAVALGITVRRAMLVPGGRVDCASAPGACVVVARAIGGPTGTAPLGFDGSTPLPPPPTLTVTPSVGLGDRYIVSVHGSGFVPNGPNGPVIIVECPAEAASPFTCFFTNARSPVIDAQGSFTTTVQVRSTVQSFDPKNGTQIDVNCGESAGRCVLLAADYNDPSDSASAPITFDPNAPPAPPSSVDVSPSTGLVDGQTVHVTADNFPPGAFLYVIQCKAGSTDASGCDISHLVNPMADDNGHLDTTFDVHRILNLVPIGPPPTATTIAGKNSEGQSPAAAAFFAPAADDGSFDCASSPGACNLSVAFLGGPTIEAVGAPLTFDASVPPSTSTPVPIDQPVASGDDTSTTSTTEAAQVEVNVVSRGPLARTGTDVRSGLRLDLALLVAGSLALIFAAALRRRAHHRS